MVQVNKLKTSLLAFGLLCCFICKASVTFQFDPRSISDAALKTRMERNISALLTEIDRAGRAGGELNLSAINMESAAKTRLQALWEDARFVCDKQTNITQCLNDYQGYQVRRISITMKPRDASYDQSLNRELTVSLNKNGVITGVRPAWEKQEDLTTLLASSGAVSDTRQRREILKWVEDFRCYYNERNLNALNQIYSDDALIITGSVVKERKMHGDQGMRIENTVKYHVQSKADYIKKLSGIFQRNRHINVKFDHISLMRHSSKENIYGVTLHQTWQTSGYSDEGWLFLLWDFSDPEHPQIHVRTWQPDQLAAKDGVFALDDFFIP